jgi:hypothetical protein
MNHRTIYIVTGSSGEYSDRDEWVVRAFEQEADAKAFVEMADAWARDWLNRHGHHAWSDAADRDMPAHDPKFHGDDNGVRYSMSPCPMTVS